VRAGSALAGVFSAPFGGASKRWREGPWRIGENAEERRGDECRVRETDPRLPCHGLFSRMRAPKTQGLERELAPAAARDSAATSKPGNNRSSGSSGPSGATPDAFRVWLRFLRLDQRLRLIMARALREIGLSIPQFDVLSALDQGAGITQRELAQQLFVTKGNVSGLIDRLVDAGLVERRRGARDRRSHSLVLTLDGKALATAGFAVQKSFIDKSLGRLRARDLALLHLLLGRWRDAAREAEGAGGKRKTISRKSPRRGVPLPGEETD
jgi:DNA-binding MarR family transcriptional regulator